MGIFNFLKKKEPSLEQLLEQASADVAARPAFYRKLLSENLFVITNDGEVRDGKRILDAGETLSLVHFTDGRIPVFTSTKKIFEKGVIKGKVNYMAMKGEDLFVNTKNATFILNPYSDYGKELLPGEIESLLSGKIFSQFGKQIKIEKDTQVQIGQPAVYPTEIIEALKKVFAGEPTINAAYLGWIYNPESDEPPHYIFCIDTTGNGKQAHNLAGTTAQKFLKRGEIIDIIKMDESSFSDYFRGMEPFYRK